LGILIASPKSVAAKPDLVVTGIAMTLIHWSLAAAFFVFSRSEPSSGGRTLRDVVLLGYAGMCGLGTVMGLAFGVSSGGWGAISIAAIHATLSVTVALLHVIDRG
jgi:hypothetical protein